MARKRDWTDFISWCQPQPADRVLDVAGGTGALAEVLLGDVASVLVSDVSEAMLSHAPAGAGTIVCRAEQLPFADASFELVTCVRALHHIDRPARAIDEMARVLTPGGRLVVEDFIAPDERALSLRWEQAERLRDPDHMRLLGSGEARAVAVSAGLTVEVEEAWLETIEIESWIRLAGVDDTTGVRIRELVGSPQMQIRAGRTRFRRPDGVSASA